jgi:hypothetical protein
VNRGPKQAVLYAEVVLEGRNMNFRRERLGRCCINKEQQGGIDRDEPWGDLRERGLAWNSRFLATAQKEEVLFDCQEVHGRLKD